MSNAAAIVMRALRDEFGLEGSLRALPGEHDLNFDVETGEGRFVFKLMRADCDSDFVDLQIKAMECVANEGLGGQVASVIPALAGEKWITVNDGDSAPRMAWLISFLPGKLMADIDPWTPRLAASIGETMARICLALKNFDHPQLDRPLKWDLRQGGWIAEHLDAITDPRRRSIVEKIVARFRYDISPRLNTLPLTPIHGDANDLNLLVETNDQGEQKVSGVLDFGDMVRAPRICEPAIAMAYTMMGDGDALTRGAALIGGFHKILPLEDHEIDLLFPLIKLRLAISVTNSVVQRTANPDNAYLTISEAPAWALLERLMDLNEETATEAFLSACEKSDAGTSATPLLSRRKNISPDNQTLSYDKPLHLVRGERHFLFDADGRQYLDAYNNVPHVGHANPHVSDAVRRQMSLLNTNTRYLQDIHLEYAERMIALLPAPLTKIVFLNSASEANEFALRLARAFTGAQDMLVMDHGYHGATTGAMAISPYKFNHPKGAGAPPDWVHVTPQPDIYRGNRRGSEAPGQYIADFEAALSALQASNKPIAGFICECLPSVGGQIVLPDGYLKAVYEMVRRAGGVCIADDVQTALGRLGSFFWGFEQQGVAPDIAVFGKPLGNGFPLAAVAMTDDIAAAFAQGPEFFSTFGGSSAACAAGNAVLDVLQTENLPAKAQKTGAQMVNALRELAEHHEIIGDVRGYGLFLGVDLVSDREARLPATAQADYIKNRLREERILIGVEGPADNVLKIRPPMTFDEAGADQLLSVMDKVMAEDKARA